MSSQQSRLHHILQQAPHSKEGAAQLNALADLFLHKNDTESAITIYQHLIDHHPDYSLAYYNLAITLQNQNKYRQAIQHFHHAYQINPQNSRILASLVYSKMHSADWQHLDSLQTELDETTTKQLLRGETPSENPFLNISRSHNLAQNQKVAAAWAKKTTRRLQPKPPKPPVKKAKISIGYISTDFRNHATTHLILPLITGHNRQEFTIKGFSIGPNDHSWYAAHINNAFDQFYDLNHLNDDQAAQAIAQADVDILIDLNGHTYGNRMGIIARKPAPIIVSFVGFPGSTGGRFYDYLITDKVCVPPQEQSYYTETIAYLPHHYTPTWPGHPQAIRPPRRKDYHLPEDKFIFAYLGQPYKITPELADTWIKILANTPDSILWLYTNSSDTTTNLKNYFLQKIDSHRIKFTGNVPKSEHLSRHILVDCILDTWQVSSHTSAVDALSTYTPIIAKAGQHWASRVSQSLLHSAGLNQLIAPTSKDYFHLAVKLAQNSAYYQSVKQSVAQKVQSSTLYDTKTYIRNLENLYQEFYRAKFSK